MSAADASFDAKEVSLNVVSVGMPTYHVLRQRLASLVAQKGAISAHYNPESVRLCHMTAYHIDQYMFLVALERRLSGDEISEEVGTGEDELIHLPEGIDTTGIATSGLQAFSDLGSQDARDCFENEVSNNDPANGFNVDVALAQFDTSLVLPITGLSPVNFISDPMRSDLYVDTFSDVRAKLSLTRLQF
jgi:hypothetical protein